MSDVLNTDDRRYMQQALALATQSLYITAPNPRVGCVLVKHGKVLGQGATQVAGGAHAEVQAIQEALKQGYSLKGATVYVTLEPCSHHGRTAPCVEALIKQQVARVVIAMQDPNPLVAGRGIEQLKMAGIHVELGLLAEDALAINPGFVSRMSQNRPWVWTKIASSLDGKTALNNGVSQWITSAQARHDGQTWRARSCVVLSGSGTVDYDNPLLNVRDLATPRQPIRAIVDSRFQINPQARLFNGDPVWLFVTKTDPQKADYLKEKNVRVIELEAQDALINLKALFDYFSTQEINEVHVEAGPRLNGALLEAGYVDEIVHYLAPKAIGSGRSLFSTTPLTSLQEVHSYEFIDSTNIGPDIRIRSRHQGRWDQLKNLLKD